EGVRKASDAGRGAHRLERLGLFCQAAEALSVRHADRGAPSPSHGRAEGPLGEPASGPGLDALSRHAGAAGKNLPGNVEGAPPWIMPAPASSRASGTRPSRTMR